MYYALTVFAVFCLPCEAGISSEHRAIFCLSVSSSPDMSEVDRQRKRREGEKRWGGGGGERVRSVFRETERVCE